MMTNILGESLRRHAIDRPGALAFVFVRRHSDEGETVTWGELMQAVDRLSDRLCDRGASRRVGTAVCCRDNKNFVIGVIAAWLKGHTVIPAAGGFSTRLVERNRHIFVTADPDFIIHDLPTHLEQELFELTPNATIINVNQQEHINSLGTYEVPGQDSSYRYQAQLLQFTSGSTSYPKPVLLRECEVAANIRAIIQTYGMSSDSKVVNWLPLFHDMGLIGSVFVPLLLGNTTVIIDSIAFMQRPVCWLEHLSKWRATITCSPNFACNRLIKYCDKTDISSIDLSSIEYFILGGEPIYKDTVAGMVEVLGPLGLRPAAIAPSYGMAEVTLLISSGHTDGGPIFSTQHAMRDCACVGAPISGLTLVIRHPETLRPVATGGLGEIFVSGRSAGRVLQDGRSWREPPPQTEVRTGDYGYLEDGALFIVGRNAHKLIFNGRNIFAEDVEGMVIHALGPGIVDGVAAIGLDSHDGQQLCLLIETTDRRGCLPHSNINDAVLKGSGVKPTQILQLRPGALPRTSSGKIRHADALRRLMAGEWQEKVMNHAN